ncbi:hypothetical protein EVAR_6976_1 [Eumeta japonica]|uniref:Uncharacterized protein n=1 Tax=Eumeta variegata TaxID=151549 RepID=A0A4C1TGK3_EUMVA|nr:hypothetical protein EVAR_6976_1 [Eumeta japonica]
MSCRGRSGRPARLWSLPIPCTFDVKLLIAGQESGIVETVTSSRFRPRSPPLHSAHESFAQVSEYPTLHLNTQNSLFHTSNIAS